MRIGKTNVIGFVCLIAVLVIGHVDYVTGYETSLVFFYLLPIIASALVVGRRVGLLMALLSTTAWGVAEFYSHPYSRNTIFVWNVCIRMCSFLTVAYLASLGRNPFKVNETVIREQSQEANQDGQSDDIPFVVYQNRLSVLNKLGRGAWKLVWVLLFRPSPRFFHGWRAWLLRCFGARVCSGCHIDQSVRVWAPWNLEIGQGCQLDRGVDCYSVDRIVIGKRTIISQGVYLCTASHDTSVPGFPLTHAPIQIGDNAWIAARAFLKPGVTIGRGGVVGACAVVTRDVEPWTVVSGNPARLIKHRAVPQECSTGQQPDGQHSAQVASAAGSLQAVSPRVVIMTFHMVDNFGAAIQTYALQETLRRLGCRTTIIDYQPAYMTSGGMWRRPDSARALYANAGILLIKLNRIKSFFFQREQRRLFYQFRTRYFRLSATGYRTLDRLRAEPPPCDVLVCGSDQIWNATPRFGVDPAYYLAFGPRQCRRVAYAPSFGGTSIMPECREEIGHLLSTLDAISVREETGVDIVNDLTGRQAAWMPDPSVLLQDYENLLVKPADPDYVFTYCLCTTRAVGRVQDIAVRLFGGHVVAPVGDGVLGLVSGNSVQMGPREWLGYIANARAVVTNSFHGTVFSVLFKKPFITVAIQGRKTNLNERLTSFLKRVGLPNRFVDPGTSDAEVERLLKAPIDWDDAHSRLQAWRDEAWAYLREAIAGQNTTITQAKASKSRGAGR